MKLWHPGSHPGHATDDRLLRRVIVTAAVVLVAVILVTVAIYAAAFLMLAPIMQ